MIAMPLAELVEDLNLYPRHAVDDANISSLVNALKAGATLPPITIDQQSKRITDGWHRSRAYRRVLGPTGVVDVEPVAYANEAEMLKDAIERNAAHGRKLDVIDQVRAVALCREKGIELAAIAKVLRVPEERVKKLTVRLARVGEAGHGEIPGTLSVALKRPAVHLEGRVLTTAQAEAHKSAPGTSYLLLANQLIDGMVSGLVNSEDGRLMAALRELAGVLEEFLGAP